MPKFKFQFATVLKHRKILEDLAQKDFQEAQAIYFSEVAKLESMHQQKYSARINNFDHQVQGGSQVPALSQVHDFLILQDIRILRAQGSWTVQP